MGPQPDDNGNDEEVVAKPKQRQRTMALKKARKANGGSSSLVDEPSTAATTMPPPPPYQDSEGQQQQGGKRQRLVWTDHLHAVFVEAYDSLGEDAVPKKILEKMNIPGVSRENVASHLQKHRLSLKQEDQRIHTRGSHQRALPAPSPSLHPRSHQAQEPPAPGPLHHPVPWQACFAGHEESQPQRGRGYDQLLQTSPDPFWSSNIPIQEYRVPPLESTVGMPWDVESGGTQTMTGFPAVPHLQEALASQAINVREVNMGQMCTKAQQEEQRCVGSKSLSPANNNLVDLYWPSSGDANKPFPWDVYTHNKTD